MRVIVRVVNVGAKCAFCFGFCTVMVSVGGGVFAGVLDGSLNECDLNFSRMEVDGCGVNDMVGDVDLEDCGSKVEIGR